MSIFSGEFVIKQIALIRRFMGQVILKKKDEDDLLVYLLKNEAKNVELLRELMSLYNEGKINEAENLLFLKIESNRSNENFATGILFYQKLSLLTDEELKTYDFSLMEMAEGFAELCKIYEIEEIL